MKIEKKHIFSTVGGLAILGGVAYYFLKRKSNSPPKDTLEKIQWYSKRFWEAPINKLSSMEQGLKRMIDQLLDVKFNQVNSQTEIDINVQRSCRKQLKGLHFYVCLDCTPLNIVPLKKSGGDISGSSYAHTICEDCFDQEIHKGHRYQLLPSFQDNFCDCGCSLLFKEKSFCKKHPGYRGLQQEYLAREYQEGEEEERMRQMVIIKELFYNLIDGFSETYHRVTKKLKKGEKIGVNEITLHFNIYLRIIFNQINNILSSKSELLYLFINIFQQKFDKPLRINTLKDDQMEMLNEKRIDKNETVYGYLARLLLFQSKQNEQSFSNLVNDMALADDDFSIYVSTHFVKYFRFYLLSDQVQIYKSICEYKYFSQTSFPLLNTLSLNTFPSQLISENFSSIEKMLLYYEEYSKHMIPQFIEFEFTIPFTMEQLITSLAYDDHLHKSEKQLKLLVERLISYQILCFKGLTFKVDKEQETLVKYLSSLEKYLLYCSMQSYYCQVIQRIIVDIKKTNNKQAEGQILEIFKKQLLEFVNKQSHEINEFDQKSPINYQMHYGIVCMSLFVYIIFLTAKEITQDSVKQAIMNIFQFDSDEEFKKFVTKMYFINKKFIPNNQTPFGMITQQAQNFFTNDPNYGGMGEGQYQATVSAEFGLYDFSILSMQLLILIKPELGRHIVSETILQISQTSENNASIVVMRMIKHIQFIYQLIFDQTPFLNFYYQNLEFIPEISDKDKQLLEKGVDETLVQIIQFFNTNAIEQQMLPERIKHVFKFNVNSQIEKIAKLNSNTQQLELKDGYVIAKDFSNLSRFGLDLRDNFLRGSIHQNFQVTCRKTIFDQLFTYQQSVLIELVAQPETFRVLISLLESPLNFMIKGVRILIYFILLLSEKVAASPDQFTQSQKQRIAESIQIIVTDKSLLEYLEAFSIQLQQQNEEHILLDCMDMLKGFLPPQNSSNNQQESVGKHQTEAKQDNGEVLKLIDGQDQSNIQQSTHKEELADDDQTSNQ